MNDETKGCATSSITDSMLTCSPKRDTQRYKIYKDWIKLNPTAPYLEFVEYYTVLEQCLDIREK